MQNTTRADSSEERFITLENVTLRVRDRHILTSTCWEIESNQNWAVLGPNGSGKSTLMRALIGDAPVVRGTIMRHHPMAQPDYIGYVSFELHQQLIAGERAYDEARYFSGKLNTHLTVRQLIKSARKKNKLSNKTPVNKILSIFGIEHLMDRSVRFLSTGEIRKILITRAVMQSQSLLILDEPFEGLDMHGRKRLKSSINSLMKTGVQVMLATHRLEHILPTISHIICLKDCRVFCKGPRAHILTSKNLDRLYGNKAMDTVTSQSFLPSDCIKRPTIIKIKNTTVRYGNLTVFKNLNWTVRKGENWAVVGPNGSGKTTLLQLITADHPQAYANEIYLFGRRRGSGESIWDIKQHMGLVSSEFQINYCKSIRVFEVVLSGFFDSVGLYQHTSSSQRNTARKWIERLNLSHLQDKRYDLLSYGERRMVLLARAVVKSPKLFILDEPCQGLDPVNRQLILELINDICSKTPTQLLYVTHHLTEMPSCIKHVFDLSRFSQA